MTNKDQNILKYPIKKISIDDFEKVGFVADYYESILKGNYGIIVLGGSEGGRPRHLAEKIASLGYTVLSLAYFNEGDHLPKELEMIPLEYFDKAKKWLLKKKGIKQDGLLIVGWSKGAELGLVLASRDNDYKGFVAIAPSSVVWPGVIKDWSRKALSSWSISKEPIPFIPYKGQASFSKSITDIYKQSLKNMTQPISHTINYERIKIPLLLFSGSLDIIWPAEMMARTICEEINNLHQGKVICTHYNYENAGHLLDGQFNLGGTKENNDKANIDSLNKIEQFLKKINSTK
ncbi:hypothetical protein A8C32_17230 [Flavivirga aquatica]|uniref:BAAT/Acyl-CoA thioester hydrolase C-terminal domain-containing protein n=1 Tax=Flavivirga aquatica TaxID=1849968 RepID=A0A1E5T837_9FLAO|nr:acyl-CoA thioester hydrolase/BAAT C-terminal domain-containing protein [Flavivirga aquatica]OEK07539.1 hypothetical protein A8C32_17230 [Flavivirga aquatica]